MPGRDRRELAAIFAGGVVGALLRVALLQTHAGAAPGWPWVTFAENILGTFLLGYFATRLQERLPLSAYRRPLLGTGFCGAFTTFSTMQLELLTMLDAHRYGLALALRRVQRRRSATAAFTWRRCSCAGRGRWRERAGLDRGRAARRVRRAASLLRRRPRSPARVGRDFPLGTFVVNLTGAAILGLLVGLGVDR